MPTDLALLVINSPSIAHALMSFRSKGEKALPAGSRLFRFMPGRCIWRAINTDP